MTALSERQAEFGGYFVAAGYPVISGAAISGNATQENMCLPVTTGPKDHGSDGSLQWRGRRLANLMGLPNWDTLKVQAEFTILELQAGPGTKYFDVDYHALEADLRAGTKSLATLTANFVDAYERPSADGRALDQRIRYAQDSLNAIMATHPLVHPPVLDAPWTTSPAPTIVGVSTLDPMLESVIEALVSGLVKAILQHVATAQVPPTPHVTTVAPTAPTIDPTAIAKSIATELGPVLQSLISGVKL